MIREMEKSNLDEEGRCIFAHHARSERRREGDVWQLS